MKIKDNPIGEAERYMQNARQMLSEKAGKDGDYYTDKKYIKLAGHAAWCGVLVALDSVLKVNENLKKGQRADIKDYQQAMDKIDKKMLRALLNSYETLHKVLGYDGNLNYKVVQAGLGEAQELINWAEKRYAN
ncbi:MAG: DUF5618 family protein [Tannerella sp.]|jgi:hypothetical protein|nr:DUF5618 family protein [Tannerella sp.]